MGNSLTSRILQDRALLLVFQLKPYLKERLEECIDIIIEGSIDEQVNYAQLCKMLADIKVRSVSEPNKVVTFRTELLMRCQKMFDTFNDVHYKQELLKLSEEKLAKAKRQSIGNVRFIGELFNVDVITEDIVNDCIARLLKQESDEESLERVCCLIGTISKKVSTSNNAEKVVSYLKRMENIANNNDLGISSRIRYMLLELIDSRFSRRYGFKRVDDAEKTRNIAKEPRQKNSTETSAVLVHFFFNI